jgi:hypothetical protein
MAARVLGKRVEEVTRNVTGYLTQLKDVTPAAREEALHKAVQEWMDCTMASGMVVVQGQPPAAKVASEPHKHDPGRLTWTAR